MTAQVKLYVAPDHIPFPQLIGATKLFLAGGITGCPDWQTELIAALSEMASEFNRDGEGSKYDLNIDLAILNPRRVDFPIDDPSAAEAQIRWEVFAMQQADIISFWFPHETLCPITLFEYGRHIQDFDTDLAVGVHPDYKRRRDVEIQTSLLRGSTEVVTSVPMLARNIWNML